MIVKSIIASLIIILGGIPVTADNLDREGIVCVYRTSDTEQILPGVRSGLRMVPSSIKEPMLKAGYKVVITPTMLYGTGASEFGLERRSSYDVGSANNIAGLFKPAEQAVYIPEKCSYRNEAPRLQTSADLIHVMLHELGHAYDMYLSYPSKSDRFTQAYDQDSARLTNTQRSEFSYFSMQEPGDSTTELFAELFSIICASGDETLRHYERGLYESFPHCVAAILALNPDLKDHSFRTSSPAALSPQPQRNQSQSRIPGANRDLSSMAKVAELVARRQYAEAISLLTDVIAKEPMNASAYSYRGYVYLALGNYKQSMADCTKALTIDPADQNSKQYLQMARKMSRVGHF